MKTTKSLAIMLAFLVITINGFAQSIIPTQIVVGSNTLQVLYQGKPMPGAPITAILQNSKGTQGTALLNIGTTTYGTLYLVNQTSYAYKVSKTSTNLTVIPVWQEPTNTTNTTDQLKSPNANVVKANILAKVAGSPAIASSSNIVNVTVLILYTPADVAYAGSVSNILLTATNAIQEANLAYQNSGVFVTLQLVGVSPLNYTEVNSLVTDLGNISGNATAQALRNQYSADIVTTFVNSADPNYSGMAYVLSGSDDTAYNVVRIQYAVGSYVTAHEISHNFGCAHDFANAAAPGVYSYSYGYVFTANNLQWGTVMAYPGFRSGYFSSPSTTFLGVATGTTNANNVSTLNQRAATIAAFRTLPTLQLTVVANGTGTVSAGGTNVTTLSLTSGQNVTLTASGNFVGWSGAQAGSSNTITVAITTNSTLTANFADGSTPLAPQVVQYPASQNVANGGTIQLSSQAYGLPTPITTWYFNGSPISTGTNLTITSATSANQGYYNCVISNSAGNVTSPQVGVSVGAVASIVQQPVSSLVEYGGNADFSVLLDTTGFAYQWYYNNAAITGATSRELILTNVQPANMGNYYVVATQGAVTLTSSSAQLFLPAPPNINSQPTNTAITVTGNTQMSVTASGLSPLNYQWQLNGVALLNQTNATLTFNNTTVAQAGTYTVDISNPNGITTSAGAVLTVYNPLTITTQPANLSSTLGATPIFSVSATGSAPITYQWYGNGTLLSNQVYSTCRLQNVQTNQAGTYYVVISNPSGSIQSSNATIYVASPPVITQSPAQLTADVGGAASFNVTVTGRAPFTYQWSLAGTPISGATNSSLTISPITANSAGYYAVTIRNIDGSITSASAALNVNTPPTILSQPQPTTVTVKGAANFSVSPTGVSPFSYQWYFNGGAISGATNATLAMINVQTNQAGSYYVIVANRLGNATSTTATLTVLDPPVITMPAALQADQGTAVTITPTLTGRQPMTYAWTFNGATLAGQTSATLTLNNVQGTNTGGYYFTAANSSGSVSASTALTVFTSPTIITQPSSTTNAINSSINLTVAATGGNPLNYQWFYNYNAIQGATSNVLTLANIGITNEGNYSVTVSNRLGTTNSAIAVVKTKSPPVIVNSPTSASIVQGGTATFSVTATGRNPLSYSWLFNNVAIAGSTNSTLTLNGVTPSQAGNYSAVVTNADGNASSATANLTVVTPPTIMLQPLSQTVSKNQTVTFTANYSSATTATCQWYFNGVAISGATTATLQLTTIQLNQAGSYILKVSNNAGTTATTAASLTVLDPPTFTLQPTSGTITYGSSYTLSCVATSSITPITYQWYKGSTLLGTNAQLTLTNATTATAGNYFVTAQNAQGQTTSQIVTLTYAAQPPTITLNLPATQTVIPGVALQFIVTATGASPMAYVWRFNGNIISNQTSATLTISNVQTNNAGTYSVIVTNPDGSQGSITCTVTVVAQAPVFATQPANIIVPLGGTATFTASCANSAGVTYQWFKAGTAINGATSSSLTINSVQNSDVASYYVQAINIFGSTLSTSAAIQILAAPTITAQPQSVLSNPNATVTFAISATGGGVLTYQWFYNGNPISATGTSYSFIATANNSGNYTVTVANAAGTVTSATATLTVRQAPSISTQPMWQAVCTGSNATFSVTASGRGTLNYQWYWNSNSMPGFTQSSLTITNVQQANCGTYSVYIANADGSTNSLNAVLTLQPAPTITSQPTGLSLTSGSTATFNVTAAGYAPLTYQWFYNSTAISGATQSTLTLNNVQTSASGYYYVAVYSPAGTITSQNAALTVTNAIAAPVSQPPVITAQPASITTTVGNNVSFSVLASGRAPMAYQWYIGSTPITGGTQATLNLTNVQVSAAGNYYVSITNSDGQTNSSSATLTVNLPLPTITTQPAGASVGIGSSTQLSVSATNATTYQWYFNGVSIAGATTKTLALTNIQTTAEGFYTVVVGNTYGTITSSQAPLTVRNPPFLTQQPGSTTIIQGGNVTFSVTAGGRSPLSYQWYKAPITPITGATSSTYTITNAQASAAGSYFAYVANSDGAITSSNANLTVQVAPYFTSTTTSIKPSYGAGMTLQANINGTAPITYQWYLNGTNLVGATNSTLVVNPITLANDGTYSVGATNIVGGININITVVHVVYPPALTQVPPTSQLALPGTNITLTAGVVGRSPMTLQWYFNSGTGSDTAIAGATNLSYTINNFQTANNGYYYIIAQNQDGMVVCTKSYVTLITPVTISYQPQNRSVPIGGTTNIFVVANSMTTITYQWYLNGIVLPGSTNSNLVISNAQLANEGNYTVTLQNAVGSVTSSAATLTVIYPPVILASPVSQTVNQGSTVNLEVLADGSQPMTYTWLFNGAPIVGPNTRILTIQNAQPAQAGKYSVLCSNLYGTATSAQATLQVMPIPVITQQPAVTIVTVSNTFQLSVTATGTGTLTYQWFQNGSIVPGATASTYGNTNAQYANAGTYTVSVANAYGTVISQPAILLVLPTQPEKIPTNPSQPIIVQVVFTPDGNTALIYYGAIGSNYVIEATSDLNTWTTVTNITPTVNLNQFIDNNATNYTQRYYRVGLVK